MIVKRSASRIAKSLHPIQLFIGSRRRCIALVFQSHIFYLLLAIPISILGFIAFNQPSVALVCGIGQPFTMVADTIPAVSYKGSTTTNIPSGTFPHDYGIGQPITLTEDLSGAPTPLNPQRFIWNWDFGDGANGTGLPIQHIYAQMGDYVIQLSTTSTDDATLSNANFDSARIHIVAHTFDQPPVAIATASSPFVKTGDSLQYNASGSYALIGNTVTVTWNFGDGFAANGTNVTHRFTVLGKGFVTLIVQDKRGARTFARLAVFVVAQFPTAIITAPHNLKAQQSVTFDASHSLAPTVPNNAIVDYHWDFGDGANWEDIATSARHTYNHAGTYRVTLTVTDAQGLPATTAMVVTVLPPTPASVLWFFWIIGIAPLAIGGIILGIFWWRRRSIA